MIHGLADLDTGIQITRDTAPGVPSSQDIIQVFTPKYMYFQKKIQFVIMTATTTTVIQRVRVTEHLSDTCLFGLESTKLLCVGLTHNISFKYLAEAMF